MIEAYHVSRSPGLSVLKPREMNSRARDGLLYGFPAVSMTTTRYHGRLPDISPYPEDADAGTSGYRYTTSFDLDDYDIFKMAVTRRDNVIQVRLLLLHRSKSKHIALAAFIRSWHPECELMEQGRTQYFPHGQANQYLRENRTFVNVHFMSKVQVKFRDEVTKQGPVFQPLPIEPYDETLVVAFRNHQSQQRVLPDDFVTGLENLGITGPPNVPADGSGSASEPEDEAKPKPKAKAKASSKSRAKARDDQ